MSTKKRAGARRVRPNQADQGTDHIDLELGNKNYLVFGREGPKWGREFYLVVSEQETTETCGIAFPDADRERAAVFFERIAKHLREEP